jgi:hypothetical protein
MIKDSKAIVSQNVGWFDWRAVVNTAMNIRISKKCYENILSCYRIKIIYSKVLLVVLTILSVDGAEEVASNNQMIGE